MKRLLSSGLLAIIVLSGLTFLSSCGEDEIPIGNLSFAESSITFNEADDVIEIEVTLSRPAHEDFTIDYSLDGTAIDKETAGTNDSYDYEIVEDLSDYGEIEIEKGETTGIIQIKLWSDFDFENTETIEIKLEEVDSEFVEITRDDEIEINIEQEDGLIIWLEWAATYNDVDMDLFLWAEDAAGDLGLTSISSTNPATTPRYEFVFIPNVVDDGDYGISCNYYSGSANPMNFTVSYIKIVNGNEDSTVEKDGTYDLGNINAWDVTDIDPFLAATYTKTGSNYSNFSDILIDVNSSGSRSASTPSTLRILNLIKGKDNNKIFRKD
jgi:hypothetical protein